MKKNKNIFKKLVGIERGDSRWKVKEHDTKDSEKWIHHILSADCEAPKIESDKNLKPFIIISVLCLLLFSFLTARVAYLQIFQGGESRILAEGNRIRKNVIRAPRGVIYDKNHKKLVKNVPNYEVTIIPADMPRNEEEKNNIISSLAKLIDIPEKEIKEKVEEKGENYTQPILIKEDIAKDDSFIISSKSLKGVSVYVNPVREYMDGGLLSHAMGYVGRINEEELEYNDSYMLTDFIGKTGLEKSYEGVLKGIDGSKKYEVDSEGRVIKFLGEKDPELGDSIVLSLDFELQRKVSESMLKVMNAKGATKGAAIAIDPRNGEILAFVNIPTYDNNLFSRGISKKEYARLLNDPDNPLLPRVMSGEYPSGSSIKPFVAGGALEEGTINENTSINSTGGIEVGEWEFPDWKESGHGITNVTKAIAESVNTFFYAIGGGYGGIQGLGPDRMKHYLELFGFGSETGIDIDGEEIGSIPDPIWKEKVKNETWYLGDTYHMAIGQGDLLVTPLQIANATCTIANGGKLYKPHFVKEIVDENDEVVEAKEGEILKEGFISSGNIEIIKRGMRQAVTLGSAKALNGLPVAVSGKTGTAQFGPNEKTYHGWFTSFAPYDNPEIALTIIIEASGGGNETAVPVARDVYRWYFSK